MVVKMVMLTLSPKGFHIDRQSAFQLSQIPVDKVLAPSLDPRIYEGIAETKRVM
jgi:hypothetical protein